MTGANTEPVRTALYVVAASLLLDLGKPLFDSAVRPGRAFEVDNPEYRAWFHLRNYAGLFLDRHSTELPDVGRRELNDALRRAHDLAHEVPLTGAIPTESCHCGVSQTIARLRALMKADELSRKAA